MEDKKRSANFTKGEIELLIDIALKKKDIIENKRTDSVWWSEKNKTWEEIAKEFNASSGNFPRNCKTIRAKYDALKKEVRRKCAQVKASSSKTGGGPMDDKSLSPHEEKLLAVSKLSMMGLKSRFDNDTEESHVLDLDKDIGENFDAWEELQNIEFLEEDDDDIQTYFKKIDESCPSTSRAAKEQGGKDQSRQPQKRKASTGTGSKIPKTSDRDPKKEVLELQKKFFQQEIEQRAKIHELEVEKLKLEIEIKKAKLKKINTSL